MGLILIQLEVVKVVQCWDALNVQMPPLVLPVILDSGSMVLSVFLHAQMELIQEMEYVKVKQFFLKELMILIRVPWNMHKVYRFFTLLCLRT